MSYPLSLVQSQKQTQSLKQLQRLIMSPQMQQAIHLLQMPVMELANAIEAELEQNPILEYSTSENDPDLDSPLEDQESEWKSEEEDLTPEKEIDFSQDDFEIMKKLDEEFRDFYSESGSFLAKKDLDEQKKQAYQESLICSELSLFEFLMTQARQTFESKEEMEMAEALIGNFDEKGFISTTLEEIALLNNFELELLVEVLEEINTFEPYGVGAKSLQESLLIQLRCKKRKHTLAYLIIEKKFDDLIHNRIPQITKALKCTAGDIAKAIDKDIAPLDLHPGTTCSRQIVQPLIPDITIKQEGDHFEIVLNDDFTPSLRFNIKYVRMLDDQSISQETKDFILNKLSSAKWLIRNIGQRNSTLERIVEVIIDKQQDFLKEPDGKLVPMTMKLMAEKLELHESTVARAVSNKYVNCPRGLLPLRSFFTNALSTDEGTDISSKSVRDAIMDIISHENKLKPLSDLKISQLLKEKGIHCARRTVAKYRVEFNIGNAQQRKKF